MEKLRINPDLFKKNSGHCPVSISPVLVASNMNIQESASSVSATVNITVCSVI